MSETNWTHRFSTSVVARPTQSSRRSWHMARRYLRTWANRRLTLPAASCHRSACHPRSQCAKPQICLCSAWTSCAPVAAPKLST